MNKIAPTPLERNSDTERHERSTSGNAFQVESPVASIATEYLKPPELSFEDETEQEERVTESSQEISEATNDVDLNPIQLRSDIVINEQEEEAVLEPPSMERLFATGPPEMPNDDENNEEPGESNEGSQQSQVQNQLPTKQFQLDGQQGDLSTANTSMPVFALGQSTDESSSQVVLENMGTAFGQDFSNVSITENSNVAEDLGAKAFAQGNEIHFAPGEFNLSSTEGRELLGHELTHVVQQRQGRVRSTMESGGFQINDDPSLENEADEMGQKVARGELLPFNLGSNTNSNATNIQRKVIQKTLSDEELAEVISGLRIRNPADQENAVRLLRENHADLEQINAAFLESTNGTKTLRQYIRRNYYDWDMKIKATALLFDSAYDHDWTRIALALIPPTTRDNDYYQIMNSLSNQQKRELRRRYNARFLMLGQGSLDADIRSDFAGVDELRAWIISYRRLTDADNIYLHTQHLTSSNAEQVASTLRRMWSYGLNTFNSKLQEWNPNNNFPDVIPANRDHRYYFHPRSENLNSKWPLIPGRAKSLILTVQHESHSDTAQQIFIEYIDQKADQINGVSHETTGWAFTSEEEANLNIARARLTSAESVLDDNEAEIDAAAEEFIAIYQGRIERLEAAEASAESIQNARSALTQVRIRLARDHEASISSLVELNFADQLYQLRNSQTNYTNKILEIYKQNKLDDLRTQASSPSSISIGGETLSRPAYDITGPLQVTNMRGGRMHNFLDKESNEAGAYWIKDSIDREHVEFATLTSLHSFINSGPWTGTLLLDVIRYFNSRNVSIRFRNAYSNNPKRAFLRHMASIGFDGESNWRTFRDALVPSSSDEETAARAREDWEQEHSSTGANMANAVSDAFTGEDTEDVAGSSLRRLERFANDANASSEEMVVFRSFYGEEEDLVNMEYANLQQRLGEMREAKNEAAAMANTIVSTAIEAILSPLISPVGGAVVGQVCGILTEWVLNPNYDPATPENLVTIIGSAATAGASRWTGNSGGFTRWINNRTSNGFLRTAARISMEQTIHSSAAAFSAAMQGNLNMEWIRGQIQSVLAAHLASGVVTSLNIEMTKNNVINGAFNDMAETVVAEIITLSSSMVFNEGEDENAAMSRLAESVITGLLTSIAELVGETHQEARQEHHENQAADRMRADADAIEENNISSHLESARNSEVQTLNAPPSSEDSERLPHENQDSSNIEEIVPVARQGPNQEREIHEDRPDPSSNEFEDEPTIVDYSLAEEIDLDQSRNLHSVRFESNDLSERLDRSHNTEVFHQTIERHPTHECALVRNTTTGEYAIVHGQVNTVSTPDGFVNISHSHPVNASGTNSLVNRNPSTRDLEVVLYNYRNHNESLHTLRIMTEHGPDDMRIRVDDQGRFTIDVVDGEGIMERQRLFNSLEEYSEWLTTNHFPHDSTNTIIDSNPPEMETPLRDTPDRPGRLEYEDDAHTYIDREFFDSDRDPNNPVHAPRYNAAARIENGTVSFDLSLRANGRRSGQVSGADFYASALQHFRDYGHTIERIRSEWGSGDNLEHFREMVFAYTALGMEQEQAELRAASETWSGRQAAANGFGRIDSIDISADGVVVMFLPGETVIPDIPESAN